MVAAHTEPAHFSRRIRRWWSPSLTPTSVGRLQRASTLTFARFLAPQAVPTLFTPRPVIRGGPGYLRGDAPAAAPHRARSDPKPNRSTIIV